MINGASNWLHVCACTHQSIRCTYMCTYVCMRP